MKSRKLQGCIFKGGQWQYRRRVRGDVAQALDRQNIIIPLSSDAKEAERLAPKARQMVDELIERAKQGETDLESALRRRADYVEEADYDNVYEGWEERYGYPRAQKLARVVQGHAYPIEEGLQRRLKHEPLGEAARRDAEQAVRELQDVTGVFAIEDVTRSVARDFVEYLLASPRARSTSRKLLQKLRALWSFFLSHELAEENVFGAVQIKGVPKTKRRAPTDEELRVLLEASEGLTKSVIKVLALTGLRTGELFGGVDLGDGVLHVRGTKTEAAERIVPVHPEIDQDIQKVFSAGLTKRTFSDMFVEARTMAGVADAVTPHGLRKWCYGCLMDRSPRHLWINQMIGHRNPQLVEVYGSRASVTDLRELVELLELP